MILIVWDKVGEIALKEIWQAVINILIKLEFEKPRPTIDNDTVLTCADTILLNWVLLRALWTLNWRRLTVYVTGRLDAKAIAKAHVKLTGPSPCRLQDVTIVWVK